MGRYFREDYTPWSFVLPIALGVMLGVLAADVVRLMVAGMMARAALQEISQNSGGPAPRPEPFEQLPQEQPAQSTPDPVPALPGLLQANHEHLPRACIGGTVSLRETNGWSQDTSTGSPQACTATSP